MQATAADPSARIPTNTTATAALRRRSTSSACRRSTSFGGDPENAGTSVLLIWFLSTRTMRSTLGYNSESELLAARTMRSTLGYNSESGGAGTDLPAETCSNGPAGPPVHQVEPKVK